MRLTDQFLVYAIAAAALAGCASGTPIQYNVVTGVDANGQPIIERLEYRIPNSAPTSTESLSSGPCLSSKCR